MMTMGTFTPNFLDVQKLVTASVPTAQSSDYASVHPKPHFLTAPRSVAFLWYDSLNPLALPSLSYVSKLHTIGYG